MGSSRGRNNFYDFVSIVLVGFTVLLVIGVAAILGNPNSDLNPFPPRDDVEVPLPTRFVPPPDTPAPPTLPSTWTPSPSPTGRPSITPSATDTNTPTPTGTTTRVPSPTHTFTPSATAPTATPTSTAAPFDYVLQSGTPRFTNYFAGPNSNTLCDWAGLAGQVFDTNGFGKVGVTVHVFGSGVDEKVTSGSFSSDYGSGGWEVNVHIQPVVRDYTVRIETSSGTPLSADVEVTTRDDCDENLVIINFRQVQ